MTIETKAAELIELLAAELARLQTTMGADYRAPGLEDEDGASMQVTLGATADLECYALQTGDNSYTGAAYGFPLWGVGYLGIDDDADSLRYTARGMVDEILDQAAYATDGRGFVPTEYSA